MGIGEVPCHRLALDFVLVALGLDQVDGQAAAGVVNEQLGRRADERERLVEGALAARGREDGGFDVLGVAVFGDLGEHFERGRSGRDFDLGALRALQASLRALRASQASLRALRASLRALRAWRWAARRCRPKP